MKALYVAGTHLRVLAVLARSPYIGFQNEYDATQLLIELGQTMRARLTRSLAVIAVMTSMAQHSALLAWSNELAQYVFSVTLHLLYVHAYLY